VYYKNESSLSFSLSLIKMSDSRLSCAALMLKAFAVGDTNQVYSNFCRGALNTFDMKECIQSKKSYMKIARKFNLPPHLSTELPNITCGCYDMDEEFITGKMSFDEFMRMKQMYEEICHEEELQDQQDHEDYLFEKKQNKLRRNWTQIPNGVGIPNEFKTCK
jgi:hypothetical protein